MIIEVDESSLLPAAAIHLASWKESHNDFCSAQFIESHTKKTQEEYLLNELKSNKHLYMLVAEIPVGIVSVKGELIENLYVLPEQQRKGYGTKLLLFAVSICRGAPRLFVLNNNASAISLYQKHGFSPTGVTRRLSDSIYEIEMRK